MNSPQGIPGEKVEELLDRLFYQEETLSSALPPQLPAAGPLCAEEESWRRIASGEMRDDAAQLLIEHAAECRRCGGILHFWTDILAKEQTAEESAALSKLASAKPGWEERITKQLAEPRPSTAPRSRLLWPVSIGSAAALAASIFFVFFYRSFNAQPSPERLLAEAYTGQRIMDARIPLAGFAAIVPSHHQRAAGSSSSTLNNSVPLLEARAAINQALMKTPEDPHWLLLEARADLLSENYDAAIDTLKRLLAVDPANVPALTDLASAYIMRSKATDVASDQATALDYLEQAKRIDPNNTIVLYNEAVVLSDLFQYNNAIEVWKKFLTVEHDPAWLSDGKRRLSEINARQAQKIKEQSRLDPFLKDSDGMLYLARSPDLVASYDEELSTLHLPALLLTAFPTSTDTTCSADCLAARTLLHSIATSLEKHHQDSWLADLLSQTSSPGFPEAVNPLARSIREGAQSDFGDGLADAQKASQFFTQIGNTAGRDRAGVELIYGYEHLLRDRDCLQTAKEVSADLEKAHSPWMTAQFWADDMACNTQENNFSEAMTDLNRSLQVSAVSGYRILHLRAIGFLASLEESIGNRNRDWTLNLQGLRTYWFGNYPAIRSNQFYSELSYLEESGPRPFTSVLFHRETLQVVSSMNSPQYVNIDHFLLVQAEIRAGEVNEAAQELKVAEVEFETLPNHEALQNYLPDMQIAVAEAYLGRGQTGPASRMLSGVAIRIANSGNRDMQLHYEAAMGHLLLLEGNRVQADAQLTQAIALAEQGYQQTQGFEDRLAWIERARPSYAALALLRLHNGISPVHALAIWERYRVLSSGNSLKRWCPLKNDLECLVPALEASRQHLSHATVFGSLRFDSTLLLWTMNDHGIHTREIAIEPNRFDLLSKTFAEMLETPQSREASLRFYGRRLAGTLLEPVAADLNSERTLIFDLDDSLEFLPVAALPWREGYLGTEFSLSMVHSLLVSGDMPQTLAGTGASLVVGASLPDTSASIEAEPLPEAATEARTVAGFLKHPHLLTGSEATAASFRNAADHASLIHFAGHTNFFDGNTRLLFARSASAAMPQSWLDVNDFRGHRFADCSLVVLSACSTGRGADREADDTQDLVQTFVADGVRQVVATHWDVDSAAAVPLMKTFYSNLAKGETVTGSLLQAERTVRGMAEYSHPYYWAPYYTVGLDRPMFKELLHE
jgi:CHAT domain-containing protein/tetratricopeptide (TPR) repeat protein